MDRTQKSKKHSSLRVSHYIREKKTSTGMYPAMEFIWKAVSAERAFVKAVAFEKWKQLIEEEMDVSGFYDLLEMLMQRLHITLDVVCEKIVNFLQNEKNIALVYWRIEEDVEFRQYHVKNIGEVSMGRVKIELQQV
jgi:hypothetical protein